jgi:antitoxin (DNA-binding transcriptional repressor) of toxin-antitoxin stability system
MREHNEYVARVVACEQSAKNARTESEKQSWLVMADSWRETVKLQETLTRQAEFIRKVPTPRATSHAHRDN